MNKELFIKKYLGAKVISNNQPGTRIRALLLNSSQESVLISGVEPEHFWFLVEGDFSSGRYGNGSYTKPGWFKYPEDFDFDTAKILEVYVQHDTRICRKGLPGLTH